MLLAYIFHFIFIFIFLVVMVLLFYDRRRHRQAQEVIYSKRWTVYYYLDSGQAINRAFSSPVEKITEIIIFYC